MNDAPPVTADSRPAPPRFRRLALAGPWLVLGLVLFCVRLIYLEKYGADALFDDEWDAIGENLYLPFSQGNFGWRELFAAHNEHRIVWTRLLALGAYYLSEGGWDVRLLQVFSVALQAAVFAILGMWIGGGMTAGRKKVWWLFLLVLGVLPISTVNLLMPFQNQFHWMMFFTLLAGWSACRPEGANWAGYAFAGTAAIFSMGSGGVVGVVVLFVLVCRLGAGERMNGRLLGLAGISAALVLALWLLRTEVPVHAILKSPDVRHFLSAAGRLLEWPMKDFWLGSCLWLPWVWLLIQILGRKRKCDGTVQAVLFLGGWVLLQILAMAWVRGFRIATSGPEDRYLDILALGMVANFAALLVLFPEARRAWGWGLLGATGWLALFGAGFSRHVANEFSEALATLRPVLEQARGRVSWYLRVGDERYIKGATPKQLLFRDDRLLLRMLHTPGFHEILPVGYGRKPTIDLQFPPGAGLQPDAFAPGEAPYDARPTWGSWTAPGLPGSHGRWISQPFWLGACTLNVDVNVGGQGSVQLAVFDEQEQLVAATEVAGMPDKEWRSVYFSVPNAGKYRLLVKDVRPEGWLALTVPRVCPAVERHVRELHSLAVGGLIFGLVLAVLWLLGGLRTALGRTGGSLPGGKPRESSRMKTNHPILAVVIVAYRSRGELPACLESLPRELLGRPIEICVVNNSRADGVAEWIAASHPGVRLLEPEGNLGFGRANNLGFRHTTGEGVLFLNPDTICNAAALEHCLRRVLAEKAVGLISPKLVLADGAMDLACRRSIPTLWDGFCRASGLAAAFPRRAIFAGYNLTHLPADGTYEVGAVNGAFMLARRAVLEQLAGAGGAVFDEDFFMYGDDLDLCIRTVRAGYRVIYDGRVQITHLKGQSVAREFEAMSAAIFDANRDVYLKHFNPRDSAWVRWKWRFAFGLWKRVSRLRKRWGGSRRIQPG